MKMTLHPETLKIESFDHLEQIPTVMVTATISTITLTKTTNTTKTKQHQNNWVVTPS